MTYSREKTFVSEPAGRQTLCNSATARVLTHNLPHTGRQDELQITHPTHSATLVVLTPDRSTFVLVYVYHIVYMFCYIIRCLMFNVFLILFISLMCFATVYVLCGFYVHVNRCMFV